MRYSFEEKATHVALWRESGLSKAGYCRESGVPYQSFVVWARAVRDEGADGAAFVQLDDDRPAARLSGCQLRVDVGALSLAFSGDAEPGWVARVLAGLPQC